MPVWSVITILLMLIVLNGLLALAEIAVVSSRRARLQELERDGDARARGVLEIAQSPERFLSTVQIGITLVSVLAGAFSGSTLAERLDHWFIKLGIAEPYAGILGLGIVVVGLTYFSLVLGELAPKRLALTNPERYALVVAGPMRALARLTAPAVSLLSASTRATLRLIGVKKEDTPHVSAEEIKIMVEHARHAGVVHQAEQDIVERVFRLGERRVSSLMTPRPEIVWVDIDDPIGETMRTMTAGGHTHYPVCSGDIENVVGIVSVKDQWSRMVHRQPPDLKAALQPPLFVPEMMPALKVLEVFKHKGRHLALVVDEYGGISGLVTLNDVLEAVVGEVTAIDEHDSPSIVQRADGSWLVDGMSSVAEVQHALRLPPPDDDDRGDYQTVGGLVLHQLGHIPRIADHFNWCGHRFEVVDMDGRRIDKVLIQRLPETRPATDGDSANG